MSKATWVIANYWHGGEAGARDTNERYLVPTLKKAESLRDLGHVTIDPDQSDAGDGSAVDDADNGAAE